MCNLHIPLPFKTAPQSSIVASGGNPAYKLSRIRGKIQYANNRFGSELTSTAWFGKKEKETINIGITKWKGGEGGRGNECRFYEYTR